MTISICKNPEDLQAAYDPATLTDRLAGSHSLLSLRLLLRASEFAPAKSTVFIPPTVSAGLSLTEVKAHVTTVDLTWSSANTTWCRWDCESLPDTNGTETGLGPFYHGSYGFTDTSGSNPDPITAAVPQGFHAKLIQPPGRLGK